MRAKHTQISVLGLYSFDLQDFEDGTTVPKHVGD